MRGVNKAIIVGSVGSVDTKYTASGAAVVNASVATNESWRDKTTGETVEKTEWHRIVMFGKLAEIASQYLNKGKQAYFEGKIQTRKWQDQNGQDRYTTEIVANIMELLGGGTGGANTTPQGGKYANQGGQPAHNPANTPTQAQAPTAGDNSDFDDIPF